MDFIKTSSPACSELVQTALSSIRVLSRARRPIEERTYRDRAAHIIRVPLRPRPIPRTDPGGIVPRSANALPHATIRARPCRENRTGRQSFAAARHNPCTAADPSARTGRHRPVTGQVSSAKTYPSV
ncbi:unnamed protein product [Microthlaspi erraticum]|uniref:Uncharacterized protein n=1 Tax=Microthlaspi erraticum TaxID=1685480 RepID=A0A6D2JQV0_9BRAS|nr:unnamed protein product [Microthlaspi erraticum]